MDEELEKCLNKAEKSRGYAAHFHAAVEEWTDMDPMQRRRSSSERFKNSEKSKGSQTSENEHENGHSRPVGLCARRSDFK